MDAETMKVLKDIKVLVGITGLMVCVIGFALGWMIANRW